jgi:hypothetical protein
LASAINAPTLATPVEGCTTRITGAVVASAIGAKSFAMSKLGFTAMT